MYKFLAKKDIYQMKIKNKYKDFLENKKGASTLEWLIMSFIAITIAVILFAFRNQIVTMITNITTTISGWS